MRDKWSKIDCWIGIIQELKKGICLGIFTSKKTVGFASIFFEILFGLWANPIAKSVNFGPRRNLLNLRSIITLTMCTLIKLIESFKQS